MATTLVIIDMQEAFHSAHHPSTISSIVKEIKQARFLKSGIVIVQYENYGRLIKEIDQALLHYSNIDYVWKTQNSGGYEVCRSIFGNCFDSRKIRVCGVNTDCCICETVEELAQCLPSTIIEVVENACNTDFEFGNDFSWIDDLKNVSLIQS